ncbi:MAG: VWA domain-containing protein, partial [Clostridia bacterium]|nr:VWA domain-containing protein [Clostridia bacterium]
YSGYLTSAAPDTTATDICSALTYTASLFKNPESARIVLISDALETDSEAKTIIKSLSANGISVDTVYFPDENQDSEVQIVSANASVSKVEINSPFDMLLNVQSSFVGTATLTPYDNGIAGLPITVELAEGYQEIVIPYSFAWGGMHVVSFELNANGDTVEQNNSFTSYYYLETFSEVLIIESISDESAMLSSVMKDELNATVVNVKDTDNMPDTLEKLRAFDEVILLNVANNQLPDGFDLLLQQYVRDIGGGLFTVCGNTAESTEDNWTANAYYRKDMYGSVYQEMLPVEVVNYTPPAGVIVIVDASGSMLNGGKYDGSKLSYAMDGVTGSLEALSERDYFGIMTLSDAYSEKLTLTPRTQRNKILAAISTLEQDAISGKLVAGGTIFSAALERARVALASRSDLEKKHIIIITDGEPTSTDTEAYLYEARLIAGLDITMSIYGINSSATAEATMKRLLKEAGGKDENFHYVSEGKYENMAQIMREDLNVPEIEDVNYETFTPTINATGSVTNGINQDNMPSLDGYYGVKKKEGATAYLMGKYTPIYTQWDYGKGRVGTFACDLNGTWSENFLASDTGAAVLNNIIYALFPSESIRVTDIEASYTGDNYTTNLSIFTELGEDEKIKVTVTAQDGSEQVFLLDATTGYSRLTFATKSVGLNTILIQKLNALDEELSSKTLYKVLSYSKEYLAFRDTGKAEQLMAELSANTDGVLVDDPIQIFENAVEYLHIVIDPRLPFAIIIIAFFLIDIAVRKFKWKWPHEIIKERRLKAPMSNNRKGERK